MTCLATPYVVPPVVPATWVPWPLQSFVPCPSFIAVKPFPIAAGELLVAGADSGVDDVGVNALPRLVVVVGVVQRQVALVDPIEPPGRRALGRVDAKDLVCLDVFDAGIIGEDVRLRSGHPDGKALERVLVDRRDGDPVGATQLLCDRCHERLLRWRCSRGPGRTGLQDDDVGVEARSLDVARPDCARGRGRDNKRSQHGKDGSVICSSWWVLDD